MRLHESDTLHESIGRIPQARRRVPADGEVHPRSGEQGDMEPDGGTLAALRGSVSAAMPAAAVDAGPPARRRRGPALGRAAGIRFVGRTAAGGTLHAPERMESRHPATPAFL